jgi:hypothetical protein
MAVPRNIKIWLVIGLLVMAAGILLGIWSLRSRFDVEDVRSVVVSTIQREAPASFYVTGYLDITATTTVENTRYLLPDLFRLNLGTSRATVRVPGRVSYGFDIRQLRPEDIHLSEKGLVEVTLPELSIYAVEANLEQMEVQTDVGWARTHGGSGQQVEQRAIQLVQQALRKQAEQHLSSSTQPQVNTAQGLELMLGPPLQAAGVPDPQFRFRIGSRLIMVPEG